MHTRLLAGVALAITIIAAPAARGQSAAPAPTRMPDGEMRPRVREMTMNHDGPGHAAMTMKMRGKGPGSIASMFLAQTAELKLNDGQVTRLAAIARRTDDRHKAMKATMDSAMKSHMAMARSDRDRMPMQDEAGMRAMHEKMMAAERADVRDALGVLTLDQQADAWMMKGEGMHGMMGRGEHM